MKHLLVFSALLLSIQLCRGNTVPEQPVLILSGPAYNSIANFWAWFKKNEARLRNFEKDPDTYLGELLTQARKIQTGLAIELEPAKNGIINMTISANGDRNLFALVKKIVAQAPAIKGWQFIAFRQRMNIAGIKGLKLKAGDHELDPGKMKFFPVVDRDSLDIIIYVTGITAENYNQVAYGGFMLLDNILGEFDCVTKVRSYDFHNLPVTKEELKDLQPLLDLPKYVDNFYRRKP